MSERLQTCVALGLVALAAIGLYWRWRRPASGCDCGDRACPKPRPRSPVKNRASG